MSQHTNTALKNVSFNFIGYVYPMILAFIVAPITVNGLGIRNYGLYIFITVILTLLGLLDLGVSTAVGKFISNYNATDLKDKIYSLIGSANSVFCIIGLIGCSLLFSIAFWGNLFISSETIRYENYKLAFIFAGLLFLISSLNSIYTIIPTAFGRFDLSTKIGLVIISIQQISTVIAILLNYSIATIFLLQFIIACINTLLSRNVSNKLIPKISFYFSWNKEEIIKFYKFGIAVFINNISSSSLTYIDRMVIPFLLGPSNLTYYSLPGNITSKTPGLANTLSSTLFPITAHFDSLGDTVRIKTLYKRSTRLLLIMSTAITITVISYPYEILKQWINEDVANNGYMVLIILAFTSLLLSILSPISNILLGLGKLKSLTKISFFMATINIILLFILIPKFGIIGAAWAYLLSVLPISWLIYEVEKKYLNFGIDRLKYHLIHFIKLLTVSLLTYLFNIFILKNMITNLFSMVFICLISIILFLFIYFLFNFFEKDDISDVKYFLMSNIINKN